MGQNGIFQLDVAWQNHDFNDIIKLDPCSPRKDMYLRLLTLQCTLISTSGDPVVASKLSADGTGSRSPTSSDSIRFLQP